MVPWEYLFGNTWVCRFWIHGTERRYWSYNRLTKKLRWSIHPPMRLTKRRKLLHLQGRLPEVNSRGETFQNNGRTHQYLWNQYMLEHPEQVHLLQNVKSLFLKNLDLFCLLFLRYSEILCSKTLLGKKTSKRNEHALLLWTVLGVCLLRIERSVLLLSAQSDKAFALYTCCSIVWYKPI